MNTENTNCFIYLCGSAGAGETEESATADRLLIELLGGVSIEGLDRMRVTMKVSVVNKKHSPQCCGDKPLYTNELADLAIRHNLDLYNDTPRAVLRGQAGREVCKVSC